MHVKSDDGETDVSFSGSNNLAWQATSLFKNLNEASDFFRRGDCGYSLCLNRPSVEGMQLKISQWSVGSIDVNLRSTAFYSNLSRFPKGSIEFDCGLVMRAVPHQWHQIKELPDLEAACCT